MRFKLDDFGKNAELVLDNDRYKVYDLKLSHLTVSVTELHPGKETRGHKHDDIEEVYFCKDGEGKIVVGEETMPFERGDVVTIPLGAFHRVLNPSKKELVFLAIFEKYERQ